MTSSECYLPFLFLSFSQFNNNAFAITSIFLILLNLTTIQAQFLVEILERTALGGHRAVVRCDATGANFGPDVMHSSLEQGAFGCAMLTEPELACSRVERPKLNTTSQCIVNFAVVPRGNCSFSEKAFYVQEDVHAQLIGFAALIVYNAKGQDPIPMSGSKHAKEVHIPAVMVKYECMQRLVGDYGPERGYVVTIKVSPGYYDLVKYLFPFVAIVGICFVVLLISLMIRVCRERRRMARKRLPRSYLKKIPTKKYKKGDAEETCAICLEDFQELEKLRILPCKHVYHCKCIDPWLTKNRKVCPICKRRVGPRGADSSDSDESDTERSSEAGPSPSNYPIATLPSVPNVSPTVQLSTRDDDPLLQNAQQIAISSRFSQPAATPARQHSLGGVLQRVTHLFQQNNIFHNRQNSVEQAQGENASGTNQRELIGSRPTNSLSLTSEFNSAHAREDLGRNGNQPAQQPPITMAVAPLTRLQKGLSGLRNALGHLMGGGGNEHSVLENEEDTLTMSREELDTLSRRTCETSDDTNGSSQSADGHSMTTMHSNHYLVSVVVETPNLTPN